MNVYDSAHQLAKAIKDSKEYKEYKKLDLEISKSPELKEMITDFRKRQFELQSAQIMGKKPEEEKLKKVQELFQIINKDPKAKDYFEAEMRLNQMMADVSKILGEVMKFE
ncbi:MAG: hypothetical protein PWQ37_1256 [Candidatus Petromonas sp.]|jgi:cell fate (sporulation/competence/biofilm development) regulator YlbF (YheA/YmcA/DUF963 family)|nr:hypothetical protein [Candidatus Petromonas sp.]